MKSIEKGHIGFLEFSAKHVSSSGEKQINWEKLKIFIDQNKEELSSVVAGLAEDWSYTSDQVWDSQIGYIPHEDTTVYASSLWATPAIEVFYKNGESKMFECWEQGNNPDSYFNEVSQ